MYEYADEINDSNQLARLNNVIEQVRNEFTLSHINTAYLDKYAVKTKGVMEMTIQKNIFNDFETINEVAEALNLLKMVIDYARATLASAEEVLGAFIKRIYLESTYRNAENILKHNVKKN